MSFETPRLFEFRNMGDRWCELVRYLRPDDAEITEVNVPPLWHFRKVRSIAAKAFRGAVHLRSVKLPDTVALMDIGVFEDCRGLENVELPRGLEITNSMFRRCNSLKRVVLPDSIVLMRGNTFFECAQLEEVVLPRSECMLYDGVFDACPKLGSVVFPDGCKATFVGKAFRDCPLLPPELTMYMLIGANDLEQPFNYNAFFDWDTALRGDIFELALKHNSFVHVSKPDLFRNIIDRGLVEQLALAEGMIDRALRETLIDYSAACGQTEITARLLGKNNVGAEKSIAEKIDETFDL